MAEVAVREEVAVVQPDADAVATPEVVEESAPETNQETEDTSEIDGLLSTFADGTETTPTDGTPPAADGKPADPYAGLTSSQVADKVRQEEAAKATQYNNSAQRQNYLNGLANVVRTTPEEIENAADRLQLTGEDRKFFVGKFNALNGAYSELWKYDVGNARQAGVTDVTRGIHEGVEAALGKDVADDLMKANHQSWDAYLKGVGESYAKKNGYVSKKERDEAVTEGQKRALGKLATAMKDRGIDIAQFTGNGGNEGVRPSAARGGGTGRMTVAQFDRLDITEQAKVPAAERAAIYARG